MIDERGNIFFKNNNSEMMVLEEKKFRATDRCSRQAFKKKSDLHPKKVTKILTLE